MAALKFKDKLIEARLKKNLTQTEFAVLLNCSVSALKQWERGRNKPRISSAAKFEKTFPDLYKAWFDERVRKK